jgi:uncharacterized damage-inducible protein DinB
MSIADAFLGEFENEAKTTRKFLERVPENKLTWKPHEKSKTAGDLALHIATTPGVIAQAALEDAWSPPGGGSPQPESLKEILDAHDHSIEVVRQILPKFDDARMMGDWSFVNDGKTMLTMPRVALLRSIMLNHWYHHRGQFGVYLRLMDCKVPSSYGPSGDEAPDFMS